MRRFPAPIEAAVAALTRLPGVGPKTALRYAYALMRLSRHDLARFAESIRGLDQIGRCTRCHMHTEAEICDICLNVKRDERLLCVVAESRDIATLEATNAYHGRYFVLGGTLSPLDGITPEKIRIPNLEKRLDDETTISEVILALSPDVDGETTMMYLSRLFADRDVKVTRLARGLPMGADLEYTDEVTLGDALLGRREA
ncbi:MAG: recombination mediator RecR [bacterium]|nr:recombination mediator RecR [bacterium]MDA1024513.1 recombination mediator RecR [bacterium]